MCALVIRARHAKPLYNPAHLVDGGRQKPWAGHRTQSPVPQSSAPGPERMPDGSPTEGRTTASLVNLANIITFGRLCAVPLAFWLVLDHRIADALLLFVAAGLSDALDGWLARRFGGNALGALMDPVADKALLVTMYITLATVGALPDWLAILVVFRDLLIVGGVVSLAVLGHGVTIRPLYISKLNTVMQIMLIGVCLLQGGFGLGIAWLPEILTWCVVVTTIA